MDTASLPNAVSQSTPHPTYPPDPPDPPPPAPHPRRHTRYTASNPNVPPPHVVINTRRRRSPHHRSIPQTALSASPPAVQGTSQPSVPMDSVPPPPPPGGQDHDRMETDEESENDESEGDDDDELEDGEESPTHPSNGIESAPQVDDVVMDTTPDHPPAPAEGAHGTAVDQGSQTSPTTIHIGTNGSVTGLPITTLPEMPPEGWITAPPTNGGPIFTQNAQGQLHMIVNDAMLDSGVLRHELDEARRLEVQGEVPRAALREREDMARRQARREERGDDDDDGSDSDESMDEPDHPYWAHFKPDTSAPDENELSAIEESEEHSGTDHEHWEKSTFEPLDDPEYVPSDAGRITWTVTGNHGTPEKPNREDILRSPSVLIGGLYWNIKYYPRGNEGTDYMSVYIECSPKPYEEKAIAKEPASQAKVEEKIPVEDAASIRDTQSTVAAVPADGTNNGNLTNAEVALAQVNGNVTSQSADGDVNMDASLILPPKQEGADVEADDDDEDEDDEDDEDDEEVEIEAPWSAAAQVACIVYNPDEPRTYAHQKSKHQYYNDNPDWGWTRFHGPWSEIHTRRRYQRKPLLQNDTLAFTVYIQVVRDQTKSLWWHPSESQPNWDSMALLGFRGLKCKEHHSSAMVAAVSAWMHLSCLVEKLYSVKVPSRFTVAGELLKPALKEIQDVLRREGLESESSDISLSSLSQIVAFFYGTDIDSKKDVVMVWKALRRVLNTEATLGSVSKDDDNKVDLFHDIAMLQQPDPFNPDLTASPFAKFPAEPHDILCEPLLSASEPKSVQETIQSAFQHRNKAFRLWDHPDGSKSAMLDMPAVLQIELHRQAYDQEARKWKKLTHEIALNETINCNDHQYSLYGMIVHSGGLDYHEYYSVVRPQGPGTTWLKYAGEGTSTRSVEVLTKKQAVTNHQGGDSESESAAVAYIAIYVKTDQMSQVLNSDLRKETLRKARNDINLPTAPDTKPKKIPKATPFRVGKRDWCAAFEADEIYEAIRGAGHLSRSFYRTEALTSALRQNSSCQLNEEPETPGQAMQTSGEGPTEGSKNSDESQSTVPTEPPTPKITVFVKQFDTIHQQLVDRGAYKATGATSIIQFLREQLKIDKDETWDFYHEHGIVIKSKHMIKRSTMFFDLSYGGNPWDGMLIIAQRRPTAAETKALEAAGQCVTPIDHSVHLLGDHNPIFYASHLTNYFFTHPYLCVPLSHGRPHGQGTHITLSGSAYTGPFRGGRKNGPGGTMHYANGDTYTGDWAYDEPDGQGTMTYAKTGNIFTGGWKKRLRNGKGTMHFNVADQEMMLCGVCYEKEMDAVFCFCGHVIACEECARRLDNCPVCREPVKRVMLLKGPTGMGGAIREWAGGADGGGGVGMIP